MTGSLSGLSMRNVRGNYFNALEETQAAGWASAIAESFTTDQPHELYKWLQSVPAPQKWKGERGRTQLREFGLSVVSDKFESTLEFDVDDVRRDKTGQIVKRVRELGMKAGTLPQRLLTAAILANATGWDGAAHFADTHSHGGTCDNNVGATATAPDAPTGLEMSTAILGAIQAMLGYTDDRGDPANEFARSFLVMVPVKYWAAAVAARDNAYLTNGVSNTLKNAGVQIELAVNPRLPGTADAAGRRFYVFRTDAPVKPAIWQEESIPDAFKTLGEESADGFWRDMVAVGSKRIVQAALASFLYDIRVNVA